MRKHITFKQYIEMLNDILSKNNEIADFIVVSSNDEEDNGFSPVFYAPTIGYYDGNNEFLTLDVDSIKNYKKQLKGLKPDSKAKEIIKNLIKELEKDIKTKKSNAVCIN